MSLEKIENSVELLTQIEQDGTVPKNVRMKTKEVIKELQIKDKKTLAIRIDKSLQILGEISEDPNLSSYIKTQIWSIVSVLSSTQ